MSLSDQEMIDILEEIAREGSNAAARIAAIRQLREMKNGVEPAESGFAKLYEVETASKRRRKAP